MLHRGAHPLHQRKGPIALGVGVHGQHHAGVAAGDQQPQRIPGHELRRNGRACVVHIGKDAGHLRDGVQCIRKLLLRGGVALRHQYNVGVAAAKGLLDGGGVRTQTGVLAKHVGGTVVILVRVGGQIAGHHQNDQHQRHGQHDAGHKAAKLVKAGQQWPVVGLIHPLIRCQRERGHKGEHGDKAQHHALCQRKAQIRADLELHEHQCQKTDDGGQAAGQDGAGGSAQGIHHALLRAGIRVFSPALRKAVDQEHRVVQRHRQLQDAARRIGDKGDGAEDEVRAVVEQDSRAKARQHQQRLRPGIGGQDQDEQHIHHRDGGDLCHLGHGGVGGNGSGDRRALQRVALPDQIPHGSHGFQTLLVLHRHGEQGAAILIIALHRGGVLHLQRHCHIQTVVQPCNGGHSVDGGKFFLVLQRLRHRDIPHHDPHVGDAAGESTVHHLDGGGGGGFRRQVVVDIVIHLYLTHSEHAQHSRQCKHRQHQPAAAHDGGIKTFHQNRSSPFRIHKKLLSV